MSRRGSWFSRLDPATRLLLRQACVGVLVTVGVILLLVGTWYGTRVDALTIRTVTSHDGPTIDAAAIKRTATKHLEGSYFHLIPRRFAWLYPEETLKQALEMQERIKTVTLHVESGTELQIDFTEYIPIALWCGKQETDACLFIDNTGYAFTKAPQLQGGSFTRYVTPEQAPVIKRVLADPSLLADADWFLEQMETVLQLYPERIYVYDDGRITYQLSNDATIMISNRHDLVSTFRYLETLLQSDEYAELQTEEFQYIDLRFGNKLFVNRTMATSTASSSEVVSETPPVVLPADTVVASSVFASSTEE
jgi:cell division septal protein FtsQ